jgi:hypothetical protein
VKDIAVFIIGTTFLLISGTNFVVAQDSTYKHQIGISFLPYFISSFSGSLNYKVYVKKKSYYNIILGGSFGSGSYDDYKSYSLIAFPSVEYGVRWHFFKAFTFNLAARLSVLVDISERDYYNETPDEHRRIYGIYVGPDLGIDLNLMKIKKTQLLLKSQIHLGIGVQYNDVFDYSDNPQFPSRHNKGFIDEAAGFGYYSFGLGLNF